MLAWSEGTDNGRQKTRNHGYDVIVGGELFTDYSDHPRKLVTKPKTQINRRRTLPASFPLVGCLHRKQLGLKDFSPKSQDAVALQQIKERGALLWLIVVISVRQSTVAAISGLHCRALVMVSSSIRLTAWLQNSKKRAERSEIDVWAESPRLSPLWLSASSSACHGLLIITVITPLPTKPSATKMPENWSWRTRQLLTCRCRQRDVAALDAKYTKELADAKAENDALRDDVAAGRRQFCTHQSSLSVSAWATTASAWIIPFPTGRHRWTGLFHPQREADHYAKTTGRNQKYINEQCRWSCPYRWATHAIIVSNTHALPAGYKC